MATPALPLAAFEAAHEIGLQASPDPTPDYGQTTHSVSNESEWNAAHAAAVAGDVIEFQNGTYSNITFNCTKSGTASKYLVIKAANPQGAILNGSSLFTLRGSYIWLEGFRFFETLSHGMWTNGNNNRITRNRFIDCGGASGQCVRVLGNSRFIEIDNNEISGSKNQSITMFGPKTGEPPVGVGQNHHVHHNYCHDIPADGVNGGEVINSIQGTAYTPTDNMNILVEYNRITDCESDAEIIGPKTAGWTIRYNYCKVSNSVDQNITLRNGFNHVVNDNFCEGCGIRVAGTNQTIENNQTRALKDGISLHQDASGYSPVTNCTFTNNWISSANAQTGVTAVFLLTAGGAGVTGCTFDGNQFYTDDNSTGNWWRGSQAGDFIGNNTWTNNKFSRGAGGAYTTELPPGTGNVDELTDRTYPYPGGGGAFVDPPALFEGSYN